MTIFPFWNFLRYQKNLHNIKVSLSWRHTEMTHSLHSGLDVEFTQGHCLDSTPDHTLINGGSPIVQKGCLKGVSHCIMDDTDLTWGSSVNIVLSQQLFQTFHNILHKGMSREAQELEIHCPLSMLCPKDQCCLQGNIQVHWCLWACNLFSIPQSCSTDLERRR